MPDRSFFSFSRGLLLSVFFSSAFAWTSVVAADGGRGSSDQILVERDVLLDSGPLKSANVVLLDGQGRWERALTHDTDDYSFSPSWGAGGRFVMFQKEVSPDPGTGMVTDAMDAWGGHQHQIAELVGTPYFWRPGHFIWFRSESSRGCVTISKPDRSQAQDLLCVSSAAAGLGRWVNGILALTPDQHYLIAAITYVGKSGIDYPLENYLYKVDTWQGSATLLAYYHDLDMQSRYNNLSVSPDGSQVLYDDGARIHHLSTADRVDTVLAEGYNALPDRDWRQLAYQFRSFENTKMVASKMVARLMLSNIDGSAPRELARHVETDGVDEFYRPASWSRDGHRLLFNLNRQPSQDQPYRDEVRMIDTRSTVQTLLGQGRAGPGAWRHCEAFGWWCEVQ